MTLKRNIILCFLILAMSAMSYAGESRQTTGQEDRRLWVSILVKISDPVLTNLANGTLRPICLKNHWIVNAVTNFPI